MEFTSGNFKEGMMHSENVRDCFFGIISKLHESLRFPWTVVEEEAGITVLLLSRGEEKSIQRAIYFYHNGAERISVHGKPIPKVLSESILQNNLANNAFSPSDKSDLLEHILAVVKRLQSYEVCVGVEDPGCKSLWLSNKCGDLDKNLFGELRYKETFRPFACHLLVSTSGYLKRSCQLCNKIKISFRAKMARQSNLIACPSTPNVYLDREQLLQKVQVQEKKLKSKRAQIAKLKRDLQRASSKKGVHLDNGLSEELIKICMNYVNCNT